MNKILRLFLLSALVVSTAFFYSVDAQTAVPAFTYKRLEGTLGKKPITLHLHLLTRTTTESLDPTPYTYYFGTYYYNNYMEPIQLEGVPDSTGMIVLQETVGSNVTGIWHLIKGMKGYWTKPDGSGLQNISVREVYNEGCVQLNGKSRSASQVWKPGKADSPVATVDMFWLEPTGSITENTKTELNRKLVQLTVGDTAYYHQCCADMQQSFNYLRNQEFKAFREMMDSNNSDDPAYHGYLYNTALEVQTQVLFNERHLLGLGTYTYYYSGGAHGMYNIRCCTYDLRNNKVLTLNDIFKKGFEQYIGKSLDVAARRRAKLDDKVNLNTYYFVDHIPLTENFYVTSTGIAFCYDPYEIASYAEGQVQLFLPFSQIQVWIKSSFKI